MSLAFLAKKSWHTTNLKNQEKVWDKQQEQEREKKRVEMLQKQLKEEREMEEMRAASGRPRQTVGLLVARGARHLPCWPVYWAQGGARARPPSGRECSRAWA
jgi:hypothetical protein